MPIVHKNAILMLIDGLKKLLLFILCVVLVEIVDISFFLLNERVVLLNEIYVWLMINVFLELKRLRKTYICEKEELFLHRE